jgi:guanine deaminase
VTLAFAIRGAMLHTPAPDIVEAWPDALIEVARDGRIAAVHLEAPPPIAARYAAGGRLHAISERQLLLPGLVDLHVHAPQFPNLGSALDLPLERWLHDHTFPLEARFADLAYAEATYHRLVATLLANGTTTAVYFATIHLPATRKLAEICLQRGQRAYVGRVAMDHPDCPPNYRDETATAVEETRALIKSIRALPGNSGLVQPIVTPRFIPACTDELLSRLGQLAAETGCAVQTHCSESDWEHAHVRARCGCTDAEALRRFGLLMPNSVLAHGNFCSDGDFLLIRQANAGIAHCPLSNVYFAGAVFPLRRAVEKSVKIGLGTDISGGAHPCVLDSARMAVTMSRALESGVDPTLSADNRGSPGARVPASLAFWLATAGAAAVLGLETGLFRPGHAFDALLLDADPVRSNLRLEPAEPAERRLERIVHTAARADILAVWVDGVRVHARA